MGYGYSLLPTADAPVSTMTFRLTPSEKRERDEWILGAVEHKLSISEIAYEVGLSEQRVKQIIKKGAPVTTTPTRQKFKTPKDAAMDWYYKHGLCKYCTKHRSEGLCHDCFSLSMMMEGNFDADGQPYSWALDEQIKGFIEQAGGNVDDDIITISITDTCHNQGFRDGGIGWGHSHGLCTTRCECYPDCQSKNFMVFSQGPAHRPGAKTYLI